MEKSIALLSTELMDSLKDIEPLERKIKKLIKKVKKLAAGNGYSKRVKAKAKDL